MSDIGSDRFVMKIENLSCRRGERLLFHGLSLELEGGQLLQLRGANGVGKSSLLRILADFLKAESGSAFLVSDDGTENSISDHTHYLGHKNALKGTLTVEENLAFWRRFYAGPTMDVRAALEAVDALTLTRLPASVLSAGQMRRVAFARLLLNQRPVWLLDEPTAALDQQSDQTIGKLIGKHVEKGGLVIAATHLPLTTGLDEKKITILDLNTYTPTEAFIFEDAL